MSQDAPELTTEVREQLLVYLADRLRTGEVLITADQFGSAAREGYLALTGDEASEAMGAQLTSFLQEVNQDPTLLLVPAVENWVTLSVFAQVRKAGWGITEVQERGTQLVREFLNAPKSSALLAQLGLKTQQIKMSECHRAVANRIAGRKDDTQKEANARLAQLAEAAKARAAERKAAAAADPSVGAEERLGNLLTGPAEMPDEAEAETRRQSVKAGRKELRAQQMRELVAHLDNYVAMGRITAEDAESLRKAQQVEDAVKAGSMGKEQGSKIRNSILAGTARDKIESQVKEAVDFSVAYLQVFEALQRIETRFDDGIRFLLEHGEAINEDADPDVPASLGPVVETLAGETETLRLLIDLMDRKEAEVRMIAAHLPPYSNILKREQGRVERVAADASFLEFLRQGTAQDLSERFHSQDRKERARPAAAMLSFLVLVNRIIKPTPFRKELRMLKIHLVIEEFYHATDDIEQARQRAQDFLKGRLRNLYPDMGREETEELQRRGAEIVQRVEDKVLADRAERAKSKQAAESGGGGEEEDGLSDEDRKLGVQIQRVTVRVAGGVRQVRYRLMPDPDEEGRFYVVRKDPESGEMAPVLRRGSKRYVERARDGSWEMVN